MAVLTLFFCSALACMAASSAFHLFGCHSEAMYRQLHLCDVSCITLLIIGTYLPAVYFGFVCQPVLQFIYCGTVVLLCVAGMILPPALYPDRDHQKPLQVGLLSASVAFALVPLAHFMMHASGNEGTRARMDVVTAMLGYYLVGFVVYTLRVPERFWPGRFDYWLHSHQWWHVFCFLGAMRFATDTSNMYLWHLSLPCAGHLAPLPTPVTVQLAL